MDITLEPHEFEYAAYVGMKRQSEALRKRLRNNSSKKAQFENHIQAAAAEMAFAKGTDRYWNAGVNTFQTVGDVGRQIIEVRSSENPNNGLIVKPNDPSDRIYVLVVGQIPNFKIVGFILGDKAKQQKWLRTSDNHPPLYIVPQNQITPYSKKDNVVVAKALQANEQIIVPKKGPLNELMVPNN